MKIHELSLRANKSKKRLGRGIGSGQGKTAGRGTKGQKARSGGGVPVGFEGGQTKLAQRLPKARGFKAFKPTLYQIVNIKDLALVKSSVIDRAKLLEANLVHKSNLPVKLLANGEIDRKVTIKVQAASKNAVSKVEKAGGKVEIEPISRPKSQSKKSKNVAAKPKREKPATKTKKTRQDKV